MAAVIGPSEGLAPFGRTTRWRWAALIALSLMLHLIAFDVLPRWDADDRGEPSGPPLRAILLPAATREPNPVVEATPAPKTTTPGPERPPAKSRPPEFVPQSFDDAIPQVAVAPPSPPPVAQTTNPSTPTTAAPATSPATEATAASDTPPKPASPPPPEAVAPISARLFYKVLAVQTKNGNPTRYYGIGSIDWRTEGDRYRSDLKAQVDFLFVKADLLASHSEGMLTREGLAPDRYTETPRKKPTIATNFNRDARQSITFSASTATMPLAPGAQDRLSVLFQIGALLRGNPGLAVAGGHIDVPVAGVRGDVDTWAFESKGIESIDVGSGPLATAHLRRAPRPESNDRTIDVWLAHADGGYPARVLYTERDGSTIEMTLDRIEAVN